MTAEPDLPINDAVPAPTKIEPGNLFLWNWRQMQVYAQACVAHATAPLQAEIEALRAEVEMLRDAFSDEDMTAGAHWFGRYVEQKRRAEQLAEAIRAYKSECDNPAKDYVMRAKRRDEMFAALNPTAAQENDDA